MSPKKAIKAAVKHKRRAVTRKKPTPARKAPVVPVVTVVPSVPVSLWLAQARDAHAVYRAHTGRMKEGRQVSATQLDLCGDAVRAALKARAEADALDPTHSDIAWADDLVQMKATHAELVAHYVKYLAPKEAYAQANG